MVTTKSKDKNSKPVSKNCDNSDEDDFGLLEVFRANNIHGHNKSIQMLSSILEHENHTTSGLKPQYSNGPGIKIFTHGTSGVEYKIEVFTNPILLNTLDNKMSGFDTDDSRIISILSTFCPLIIDFKVYAFNPLESQWHSICIDSEKVADFGENNLHPHRLDVVASLILMLVDDLSNAKLKPLYTIRRFLLNHWKSIWLINKNMNLDSIDELIHVGTELSKIENGN